MLNQSLFGASPEKFKLSSETQQIIETAGLSDLSFFCTADVNAELHYQEIIQNSRKRVFAGKIESPLSIPEQFDVYSYLYPEPIILFRNLEQTDSTGLLKQTRSTLFNSPSEALSGSSASYSRSGGSVGYHADNYFVIIIQLKGRRKWNIWNETTLTLEQRAFLIREDRNEIAIDPILKKSLPHYSFDLSEGEAVVIPALCPHEGITPDDSESLSLSFYWETITGYSLLRNLLLEESESIRKSLPDSFYTPLDYFPHHSHFADWKRDQTEQYVNLLNQFLKK